MARQAKTQRIIDQAVEILTDFHPMTVRQVYYQLVSRQVVENNRSRYQAVSDALVDARLEGIIPWDWIEDRLRLPRQTRMWPNVSDFLSSMMWRYNKDVWQEQPRQVECFAPEVPIITAEGIMPIGAVQVGDLVLTQDGSLQPVEIVMRRDFDGQLSRIAATGFPPFRATPEHPVLCRPYDNTRSGYKGATRKFGEPEFRPASSLKPFDLLMVPRIRGEMDVTALEMRGGSRSTPIATTLDDDLCRLVGTYLAEGMVRSDNRTTQFTLGETEVEIARHLHAWAQRHRLGSHEVLSNGARVVYIFGKALADWLRQEFGSGSYNKRLPDWFMLLPCAKQMTVMHRYFLGDATFKDQSRSAIDASTRSQCLAQQIQLVLIRNGYGATMTTCPDHGSPRYEVNISGSYGEQLAASWGIALPSRQRRYNHMRLDEEYAYFPVRRVEQVEYNGPVVNLSVAQNHTYCLPCVVHNCWCEKDALSGIFSDVVSEYGVMLNVGRGYDGWSSIHIAAERYGTGENVTVLYFGDFDPSGEDMFRSLQERLRRLGSKPTMYKVALSQDDVQRYQLPPNFTKTTDTRRAGFVALYGDQSVELDALPATVLRGRIVEEIERHMDLAALKRVQEQEEQERSILIDMIIKMRLGMKPSAESDETEEP